MEDNLDNLAQTLNEIITTTRSKRRNTIFPHTLDKLKQQKAELIKLKSQSRSIKKENADLEALISHPSLSTKLVPITGALKSNKNLNGGHQNTNSRSKSDHYVSRASDNNRNRTKTSTMVGKSVVRSSPNRKGAVKSKTPEPNKLKWGANERNRKLNTRTKSADRNPRSANTVRGSKQRARSFELSPKTKVPNKEMRGRSPFKRGSRTDNCTDCMQQCSSKEIIVISRPQTPCSDRDSRIAINLRNISSNSQIRLSLDSANRCQNRATATLEEGECQCLIEDLKDEIEAYRENGKTDCCQIFTPIRVEISSRKESQQKVVTEPSAACDYLDRLKEEIFKYRRLATDHEIELAEIRKEIQDYRKSCLCASPPCELPKVSEESTTSSLSHTDENVTPDIPSDEAESSTDKVSIRSENSSCVCEDDKKAKIEPESDHFIITEENVTPGIPTDEAGSSSDKMSIRSENSSCICADDMKAKSEPEGDHYIMTEESMQPMKEEDESPVGPSDQEAVKDVEETTSNDETSEGQHDEDIPIEQTEEDCDCKKTEDQDDKEDVNGDDKARSDENEEEENAMRVKTSEVKSEIEDCVCDGYKDKVRLQKEEEESPQAKTDVDPELCISSRFCGERIDYSKFPIEQ